MPVFKSDFQVADLVHPASHFTLILSVRGHESHRKKFLRMTHYTLRVSGDPRKGAPLTWVKFGQAADAPSRTLSLDTSISGSGNECSSRTRSVFLWENSAMIRFRFFNIDVMLD